MRAFFHMVFLFLTTFCVRYRRISTAQGQTKILAAEDSLISTMGIFKATLKIKNCVLLIEAFNNSKNSYQPKGQYKPSTHEGDCNSLTVKDGFIQTDKGNQYISVTNQAYNHSTVFTIDDTGVMRLIGTFVQQNRVQIISAQTVIQDFKTPQKYIAAFSQLNVQFQDIFEPVQNQNKWIFLAQTGELKIQYADNGNMFIIQTYGSFSIKNLKIYDFNQQTFPGALFTNITFQPRCSEPQNFLDFKPPYVFVADPYWPIFSLFQQGGYKILEVAYSKLSQFDFNENSTQINYYQFYSPCPSFTFAYQGKCVAKCPEPYYHQIKGEVGFCVLSCQEYSIVDQIQKVCSCVTQYQYSKLSSSKLVIACPSKSIQTFYGCKCLQIGHFFDRRFTFSCVKQCPKKTIPLDGICMQCPSNCLECQLDSQFHRQYLTCTTCAEGYQQFEGRCTLICNPNYGYSYINKNCQKCTVDHCIDCSNDVSTCLRCDLMYSLENGACVTKCPEGKKNVYHTPFQSTCLSSDDPLCQETLKSNYKSKPFLKCDKCLQNYHMHEGKCVQGCPAGFYLQQNNYCTCGGVANLTMFNQCLKQFTCPIAMTFDIYSHSCLSCPFGCLTCDESTCTSCYPGYFLFISPRGIFCKRKSPLYPCNKQYQWQRKSVCLIKDFVNPDFFMQTCLDNVPNCQVCTSESEFICTLCKPKFYLYNRTCISQCPSPLIPYENSCILPQIDNCQTPHLKSFRKQFVVTSQLRKESSSYKVYIRDNGQDSEPANDPIGYIPYFQQLITFQDDKVPRETHFIQPRWVCLKCKDGFGLSEDFLSCQPCPSNCKKCYMAASNSCLNQGSITPVDPNKNNNTEDRTEPCMKNQFMDRDTLKCTNSCNQKDKFPEISQNRLLCNNIQKSLIKDYLKIDASIFQMSQTSNLVFFIFSQTLARNNINISITGFQKKNPKLKNTNQHFLSNTRAFSRVSSIPNSPSKSPILSSSQYQSIQRQLEIQQNRYITFKGSFSAFLLNASDSILQITGTSSVILPNTVYGISKNNDHTAFMKTWLAYIGYIMSITILLVHCVFIGNGLLYKVDNLLIFIQTVYFFQYTQNLVGKLLSQFYYGWSFSHAKFLPNLFDLNHQKSIIPYMYYESEAPISYKLINIDGNYFRNAGFSLAWFLIYLVLWILLTFCVWLIYKKLRKVEVWLPRLAKQSLLAEIQFFSMNLLFFSYSNLAYPYKESQPEFQSFFQISRAFSAITITFYTIYTILRLVIYPIGGIYMLKRMLIPLILTFSFENPILIIPLLGVEIFFTILRHIFEQPLSKLERRSIWVEFLILFVCYFLLFFCNDAGVNTTIISIVIFIFLVYLCYDLTTVYLQYQNEFPEDILEKQYEEMLTSYLKDKGQTVTYSKTLAPFTNMKSKQDSYLNSDNFQ